jgi:hypothetical protein
VWSDRFRKGGAGGFHREVADQEACRPGFGPGKRRASREAVAYDGSDPDRSADPFSGVCPRSHRRSDEQRARGSTSIFTPTYTAQLWVETNDFKRWVFVLGMGNGAGGIAADWVVELAIKDDRSVSVGTSRWLAKDGAPVQGGHHDALRTELLRAVGVGRLTEEAGEAEVTASSLRIAQRFETPARGPEQATFSYSTTLDVAVIRERLQQAGLPVISSSPESITWGLGLPKHNGFDYASASLSAGSVSVDANVGSQSETARRISFRSPLPRRTDTTLSSKQGCHGSYDVLEVTR